MNWIQKNIRLSIYLLNILIAIGIYLYNYYFPGNFYSLSPVIRWYGLLALFWLFVSLLHSPLYSQFPRLPHRAVYLRARRATGVSAWAFAQLHGNLAMINVIGGPQNLESLDPVIRNAVLFGSASLWILTILAVTSFDFFVKKMGRYWKVLHRLVYVAAILVFLHTTIIRREFGRGDEILSVIINLSVAILLILEGLRFDKYLTKKFKMLPRFNFGTLISVILSVIIIWLLFLPV